MLREVIYKHRKWTIIYILTGIFIQFFTSLSLYYFQEIIDNITNESYTKIFNLVIIYGILLGSICLLSYFSEYPNVLLNHSIRETIKLNSLKKMSEIKYQEYQKFGMGEVIKIIENGSEAGKNIIFSFYLRLGFELIPTVVINLLFLSYYNMNIMLVIIVGYICVFIITNILLKVLYKLQHSLLKRQEQLSKYSVRSFMELVVFRVNRRYEREINRVSDISKEVVSHNCKITMVHELFFTMFALFMIIIKIFILVVGIRSIYKGQSTIGITVAMISFVDKIYSPIAIFNVLFVQFKLDKLTFSRYEKFYYAPSDENLNNGSIVQGIKGNIDIMQLFFSYKDKQILHNINLHIKSGETVAIVGESGGGKSTLIKLVVGLLKKEKGQILIDGKDIDTINLNSLYNHISYLSQDVPVFDATVRENIVFDEHISDKEILNILEKVLLKEKVESLKEGLNTPIGERGVQFSGGEKQRLAFARVYAQNRNLVILDEPVSALDSITEQEVMKNMIEMIKHEKRTAIIIAHQLRSIKEVDCIYVIKNNRLLAKGDFSTLYECCSYFRLLYEQDNNQSAF